jgi:apolipoprotein N-acyltransferase
LGRPVAEVTRRRAHRWRGPTLGALSGVALACAAPPPALYPLAFLVFVPLLRAADGVSCRAAGFAGWVTGTVFYLSAADWLPATIMRLQGVGAATAWCAFGVFAAGQALQFALAAAATAWLAGAQHWNGSQRESPGPVSGDEVLLPSRPARAWLSGAMATAATWVLLDWGFPKVFPWSVGNLLGPDPRLRQGAALGGVYGLALLVMIVNALLAEGARWSRAPAQRMEAIGTAVGLVALAWMYGSWRAAGPRSPDRAGARVAILQGGMVPTADDPRTAAERALATYTALSRVAAPTAELLVWPENALRVFLRDNDVFARRVARLAAEIRRPLLLGALDRSAAGARELNSAYLFAPTRVTWPAAIYHKAALVPFGEYVPGAAWSPVLRRWRTTGDFGVGAAPEPIDVDLRAAPLRLAPSICFEAIRAGAFNDLVRRGAALLVNLTDDGWFASDKAAAQHLELTRLRAVETGRWLVRASSSGISAFVDPTGRIVAAKPYGGFGALVHRVDAARRITPYVQFENWVVVVCALLAVRAIVWRCSVLRQAQHERKENRSP